MAKRSFEFVEGTSKKFWEVWRDGLEVWVRFGRIGTDGQSKVKVVETEALGKKLADTLAAEKVAKGYREVGKTSAAKTASPPTKSKAAPAKPAPAKPAPAKPAPAKPAKAGKDWSHPLAFAPVSVDAKLGVIAVYDGNQELTIFDADRTKTKVPLTAFPAAVTKLALVDHDGPCIVATWDDGPEGRGIGIMRLDGTAVALRHALSEEEREALAAGGYDEDDDNSPRVLLRAVSLDGTRLAWQLGYDLHVSTVADLVAGKPAAVFEDVDLSKGAFDERGVLYGKAGITYSTFDLKTKKRVEVEGDVDDLVPWGGGLVSAQAMIRGGKITPLDARPWQKAIGQPKDAFTLGTAASNGKVICVGPGHYRAAHLCFLDLDGKLISVQKRAADGVFFLFALGDELVIIGDRDKKVIISSWPTAD